jgi:hypothetical protein
MGARSGDNDMSAVLQRRRASGAGVFGWGGAMNSDYLAAQPATGPGRDRGTRLWQSRCHSGKDS